MTSSSHASDLSMDEILASIRKIISEDPKPAAAPVAASPLRAAAAPTGGGAPRSASQIMTDRNNTPGMAGGSDPARPARALQPALDDDILDLMEEDRGAPMAAIAPAVATRPIEATPAEPKPVESAKTFAIPPAVAPPSLNEMWTPREWPRPGETTMQNTPAQGRQGMPAQSSPVRASNAPEARLEAAIAALGQSLSAPPHTTPALAGAPQRLAEPPAKPIVVASAPMSPPNAGPRIDVVAAVNAATRAALAQRSADEQTSAAAFAVPVEDTAAAKSDAAPAPRATTAQIAPPPTAPAAATQAHVAPPAETVKFPDILARDAVDAAGAAVAPIPPVRQEIATVKVAPPDRAADDGKPASPVVAMHPTTTPAPVPARAEAAASLAAPQANVAGVQTLEDTVARLLRPMLRQWLDDNMPRIVEKAFKEELAAQATPPKASKMA